MVVLAPHYTQREFRWTQWKSMQITKNLVYQHEETPDMYTIWGYDGPEAIITYIWKGFVPQAIIDAGYSQAQNDSDLSDWEVNYKPLSNRAINGIPAFAAKNIGSKRLFKRVHGISASVSAQSEHIFTIPYNWAKITGVEIIGGEVGDKASFLVLDTPTGSYSGQPNYPLNQFGFNVNIAPDYYEHKSEFDADLYLLMQIKIIYDSVSVKTIGINFILNEVK